MVFVRNCGAVLSLVLLVLLVACSDDKSAGAARATLSDAEALMAQGRQKSRMCSACHGPAGISRVASYPSIAGKPEAYLAGELQAFRNGERENPMMSSIAKSLSDEDVAALAHYFASLPSAEAAGAQP